jgi:DNA-binding PadR family transcriptional regulator
MSACWRLKNKPVWSTVSVVNTPDQPILDDYILFRLLCELERGAVGSQRELARRLDGALGMVNNYLKAATAQGWVRVKELPGNRCSYRITSRGTRELKRLALLQSRYLHALMEPVLDAYRQVCLRLRDEGVERIDLCGIDPGSILAWQAVKEAGIEVGAVMDSTGSDLPFMGRTVVSLVHGLLGGVHRVLISSPARAVPLRQSLLELGVSPEAIIVPSVFVEDSDAV